MKTSSRHLAVFFLFLPFLKIAGSSSPAQVPDAEAYRKFALTHQGDPARGKLLFSDARLICANCHSVDGSASKAGPDLMAAGDAFGRRDLVDAVLLGKMLRIDVNQEDAGLAYAVPRDNPFVGQPDARPEIWAYGLRNPWRFCFDRLNGDLWLADVGQDRVEEVDLIRRGDNHGWNVYEGYEPFSNQYRREGRTYAKPVFAYRRKYGNSITGGHVYRADKNSSFYGVYVCADYTSKRLFGITLENGVLTTARQIGTLPQRVASFSEDAAGNHFAVGYEGTIYQIDFKEGSFL